MVRVRVDHTWGIMCPRCYKVASAADTGLQDMIDTVDLLWWMGWKVDDKYTWLCDTCGKERDDQ